MVKNVESRVESDFRQRIEKLETKLEKEVEDFLLKKFDSMMEKFSSDIRQRSAGAEPPESGDFSVLKENVKEIMDIQEELVSKIQQKGTVDEGDVGRRLNELSASVNINGRDIKRLTSQVEELRNRPASAQPPGTNEEALKEMDKMISGLEEKVLRRLAELENRTAEIEGFASKMKSRNETPAASVREPRTGENEQKLLSRIDSLESELYGMKKAKKRNFGAVILE